MQHPPKKQHRSRSRTWLGAGAAALLLASAAFVMLIPRIQQRHPAQTQQVPLTPVMMQTLESRNPAELAGAVISPASGEPYTLACVEGRLYLQEESGLKDINDAYHDELLSVLTQIVSQQTVAGDAAEVEAHLADMGLAPAKASALIQYRDGSTATLEVGGSVPNTTYAYYRWSGDPGIYMCDVGIAEAFALTSHHLLPVEQPVLYGSLTEALMIRNANGESRFTFQGSSAGSLVSPHAYPLSADAASTLTTALQNLRLGTREAEVTEENRASFGLEEPLCVLEVRQKSGFTSVIASDGTLVHEEIPAQSLRFVIGREEGDYFYTCEYEGSVYHVSRFLVQQLVEADWRTLVTRTPAAVESGALAALRIEAPQKTIEVTASRAERVLANNEIELDANGNPVWETTVAINGTPGTQEQLDEITDRLNTFTVSGTIPQDAQTARQPRWTLEWVTEDGTARRVEAFRMDAFSDALRVDGVMLHYIHSDAVETLLSGF